MDNDEKDNSDERTEEADKAYGNLPPETESKDLFSNDVDNLEEAVDTDKVNDSDNDYLAKQAEAFFSAQPARLAPPGAGSHRGHVKDPAHDHRLKQNKTKEEGRDDHGDDHDGNPDDDAQNEAYERAQQRRLEEHKRLLEQSKNDQSKELSLRQHDVNMQNAHSPINASLLSKVRQHASYGAEMSRRITAKPTASSLGSARTWLKAKIAATQDETQKKELYELMSKVATLLIEAGALNIKHG
jgi:hypothetical protein